MLLGSLLNITESNDMLEVHGKLKNYLNGKFKQGIKKNQLHFNSSNLSTNTLHARNKTRGGIDKLLPLYIDREDVIEQ